MFFCTRVSRPRLVDRHFAAAQGLDLRFVLVDPDHVHAEIGEAGPGDQSDVSATDDAYVHLGSGDLGGVRFQERDWDSRYQETKRRKPSRMGTFGA
jgi:hypothetical protein